MTKIKILTVFGLSLVLLFCSSCSGLHKPKFSGLKFAVAGNESGIEEKVLFAINQERRKLNLPILQMRSDLRKLAREHSRDMASMRCLTHKSSDDKTIVQRARRSRLGWLIIGENVARNKGYTKPGMRAVSDWLQSPGHRANLLAKSFSQTGIGVCKGKDGYYYFTQIFMQPADD